jgi:hypothetical protein
LKEFAAETAKPNPRSTINSYRSFGYNLSTAIADIIDNCITAEAANIWIDHFWDGRESWLTITDDGKGMDLPGLIIAMTPGSKNPDSVREENDLGRFGMGLKTASFSQCKRLTVSTKTVEAGVHNRCWDIDLIDEHWTLYNYISKPELNERLQGIEKGTVVIWEKLDRLVGDTNSDDESVKRAFYHEMRLVKEHISLVFHRFLQSKKLTVFINNLEVEYWNPFLLDLDPKPEKGTTETLEGKVNVTYHILPHMSRIKESDYQLTGGPLGWYHQQGFYVYRADRLLVAGDWLGLEKKREYAKLARISIDFPNSADFDWNLDIKKSTATPPVNIRKDLSRIAKYACIKSAQIYNWRGQKKNVSNNEGQSLQPLWYDETSPEGTKKYRINKKHPLIAFAIDSDGSVNKLFTKAIKLIEENIPLERILYNQEDDPANHELEKISAVPSDALINLAKQLYDMDISRGTAPGLAADQLMNSIPFNQFPLIREYLQ